jgi:hypothetical protein
MVLLALCNDARSLQERIGHETAATVKRRQSFENIELTERLIQIELTARRPHDEGP